jgi:hypothetical protein
MTELGKLETTDSPDASPGRPEVPARSQEQAGSTQEDEHAEMRQTVARQYADALGKQYEPPDGEVDEPQEPRFADAEIDKRKVAEHLAGSGHALGAAGIGPKDADLIEQQIHAGMRKARPIAGPADTLGRQWTADVPVTGPSGTVTLRTTWMVDAGSRTPRLIGLS